MQYNQYTIRLTGNPIVHCPFCHAHDTKVIDSRLVGEGNQVRRRRECIACVERFTTYEVAELVMPRVIKSDGSRMPFDPQKLQSGLTRALEKRPVSSEAIEDITHRVMHRMRATGEREISSSTIGEWVMEELRKIDEVAYVRFASVYRSFQDVNEFREEIRKLQTHPTHSAATEEESS